MWNTGKARGQPWVSHGVATKPKGGIIPNRPRLPASQVHIDEPSPLSDCFCPSHLGVESGLGNEREVKVGSSSSLALLYAHEQRGLYSINWQLLPSGAPTEEALEHSESMSITLAMLGRRRDEEDKQSSNRALPLRGVYDIVGKLGLLVVQLVYAGLMI